MSVFCILCICLFVYGSNGQSDSTVNIIRMDLSFEQNYTFILNNTVEYILQFNPSVSQRAWPNTLWISAEGGDPARPLLLTARQRNGAITWQLPYYSGSELLHEMTRVLCPETTGPETSPADCGEVSSLGSFSLHMGSSCAGEVVARLRAAGASDARLLAEQPLTVQATQASPGMMFYQWEEQETSVKLRLSSPDDVCALVAIHNYTCPLPTTQTDATASALRMSMLQVGAVQVARSQFPQGFFVVVLVLDSDRTCVGALPDEASSWLWDDALFKKKLRMEEETPSTKEITVSVEAALSFNGYIVVCVTTLALFVACYVAAGALILAQRWTPFGNITEPKAVLYSNGNDTEADVAITHSRQRRLSTATFDSSDNSDSDDELPAAATSSITLTTNPTHTYTNPTTTINNSTNANTNPTNVTCPNNHTNEHNYIDAGALVTRDNNIISAYDTSGRGTDGVNVNNEDIRSTQADNVQQPFGLPPSLRLAALSRRRARTLDARADRYLYTLLTVSVFYALPVVQFVIAFQVFVNVSGSLDTCYYNFLCAHPLGALSDFNHVISNIGYLLLGALFCLQIKRRRSNRKKQPKDEEYGIPAHYGLLTSLGVGMMVVALLSASYHLCPNRLNFQFDTAFMYVLAVISMVKIYQSRHPDLNARAHATFGILAVIIALGVWGVLGGGVVFWALLTVLHVFTFLLLSLSVYYLGQFRLEKNSLALAASSLKPLYVPQMILLLLANALNWGFAIYGLVMQPADFATYLLSVLLGNTLLYMVFYMVMKLVSGERLRWYAWCYLAGAAVAWMPGIYFFITGTSMWSTTPALSRHYNEECLVMQFYDSHDLWHILSAFGLYLTFNVMLTWDDGLSAIKRTEIAVF